MSGATHVETHADVPWLPAGSSAEVWLDDGDVPSGLCTSAFVLAFDGEGRMLMSNVLKRGPDIPGGHVEPGEEPDGAAVREALEETGATVRLVGKVGHLRLLVPAPPAGYRYPAPVGYQAFYAGVVEATGPMLMPEECGEPFMADPQEIMADPRFRLHRELVEAAAGMAAACVPAARAP
jgi:8-oxo-dGTP pyrophosphatase MutT (NUDIX family)